jgi:alkylhydroperoxidase family enzyme
MQVLNTIDASTAEGRTRELFSAVERRLHRVPNMLRLMANSPGILAAYLQFTEALEHTRLTPRLRSLLTVAISELNGCDYTLSTVLAPGRREGIGEDEFTRARRAEASDPKTAAALRFAATAVRERGHVPPAEVEALRNAGFTDEEIVEIIGAVGLNLFRNYFNLIAGTEVDFPLVRAGTVAA